MFLYNLVEHQSIILYLNMEELIFILKAITA